MAGVALAWQLGFVSTPPEVARFVRLGDSAARRGDLEPARVSWRRAWDEGLRHPALAARLGWAALQLDAVGEGAVWVIRGHLLDARDPGLAELESRVREAGGLLGVGWLGAPVRRLEWSLLALVLGLTAGLWWPRRGAWIVAVLAVVAGLESSLEIAARTSRHEAVITTSLALGGEGLVLEPGQVVRVVGRQTDQVVVEVTRGTRGLVAPGNLIPVLPSRPGKP
ncbi:MAG: hypothetical protein HOP12_07620 [Candidatus Eisenbacteria bacterium]|uniref:Uncharacterized protein n=1 Tax=Eiseniibacteriota bacterium TaxID=2212470 RepID=A0A849SF68_UNCEI|nr:hypothetical protein [Candidatus Eisenbacteria bacterium]